MPIRIVQSKQNARLKELRKALAHPGRHESGLVGIEGPKLVDEALRARLPVDCIFTASESTAADYQRRASSDVEIVFVPGDHLRSVLATESPQPVAALVQPPNWTWANILQPSKTAVPLIVVLAGIQDPGNLGTILRSAEAFEANGVICLPGTVNVWNTKAVRASAGSVFRMPVLDASEDEAFTRLQEAGVRVFTTAMEGAQLADRVDLAGPVAFVVGNEGNGVPPHIASRSDGAVTIPCPGPVESLNAAVAASVLLYEAARQRDNDHRPRLRRGEK